MWDTILQGLAGGAQGLNQGLGNLQDYRQIQERQRLAQVETQLRQRQVDMENEQNKRRAVLEARQFLNPGQEVTPDQFKNFAQYGLDTGIVKGPTGGMMVDVDPLTKLKLTGAQADLDINLTKLAEAKAQQAAMANVRNMREKFFALDPQARQAEALSAGIDVDDVQTPQEKLQNSATLAAAQARAYASSIPRPMSADQGQDNIVNIMSKAQQDANAEIKQLYPMGVRMPPGAAQQIFQKHLQKYQGALGGQMQGNPQAAAPTSMVIGKYKVDY